MSRNFTAEDAEDAEGRDAMEEDYRTDVEAARDAGKWPNCSTPDCPAKVCFRFKNGKCWPCTMGMPVNWYEGMGTKLRELISNQTEAEYWEKRKRD